MAVHPEVVSYSKMYQSVLLHGLTNKFEYRWNGNEIDWQQYGGGHLA